jgi:hypothetical protein
MPAIKATTLKKLFRRASEEYKYQVTATKTTVKTNVDTQNLSIYIN